MYGSPAMNKDLNLPFPLSPYKHGKEDSDLQQQMGSGLLRYRSTPSTVLGVVSKELLNPPTLTTGPETEPLFPRFGAPDPRDYLGSEKPSSSAFAPQPPHVFFQWHQPQQQEHDQHHNHHHQQQNQQQLLPTGLVRHTSSPAGLFANLNVESSRFATTRGMGSAVFPQISGIGTEGADDGGSGAKRILTGYRVASWDDSAVLSDSFGKRIRDPSEIQNGDMRGQHHMSSLTHHLSLPKSSEEMAEMERYLQFQDAVPCKARAKRGCATHPRSIAERVRRTRISERIKKLQELVPNMDKQTNTADMLDLAVDYIKDLQRQAKALSDSRANCTCSKRHKQ